MLFTIIVISFVSNSESKSLKVLIGGEFAIKTSFVFEFLLFAALKQRCILFVRVGTKEVHSCPQLYNSQNGTVLLCRILSRYVLIVCLDVYTVFSIINTLRLKTTSTGSFSVFGLSSAWMSTNLFV